MNIGVYKTLVPNAGLGREAIQFYEIDPDDFDGGKTLGYLHEDMSRAQVEAVIRALYPDAVIEWVDQIR